MTPRWIADQAAFEELVDTVLTEPRYALDTEFHRERTYFPRLALVQIAWSSGIALIDPLAVDIKSLARLLESDVLAVLHAETPVVTLVGKSSALQVREVLQTSEEENLAMIGDSVRFLRERGREVVFDAEHFFDGFAENPAYALATLRAASEAGQSASTLRRSMRHQSACAA